MTTVTVTVYGHCTACDAVYPREGYVTYRAESDDYLVEPCDPQHECEQCGAGIEWKGQENDDETTMGAYVSTPHVNG